MWGTNSVVPSLVLPLLLILLICWFLFYQSTQYRSRGLFFPVCFWECCWKIILRRIHGAHPGPDTTLWLSFNLKSDLRWMTGCTVRGQLFNEAGLWATDLIQYQLKGILPWMLTAGYRIVEQSGGVRVSIIYKLRPFWEAMKRPNNLGVDLLISARFLF